MKELFRWNGQISSTTKMGLYAFYAIFFFLIWQFFCPAGIPKPLRVWEAWLELVGQQNLIGELFNSAQTCLLAMFFTIILTLFLAYLSRIPFFEPLVMVLTRFRFLSLIGLSFIFLILTSTSYQAKITTMSFSIMTYLLTGLIAVIRDIPQRMYNYSRTLRMSDGEVTWYTVVRGTLYEAVDLMAQNFAIAWMMLTSIESMFREYGGIGALLTNVYQRKGFEHVFAIQITILLVGLSLDSLLKGLIYIAFPWKREETSNPLLKWISGS
jgi:ABC-type nitrate/sulfonate/bicarbonate transport system permease component